MPTVIDIEQQAKMLALENRRAEPTITRAFWFPHASEVRLVQLTPQIPATEDGKVHPFYFPASPAHGITAPSGVALIRPEEYRALDLPRDWASWNDAVELPAEQS